MKRVLAIMLAVAVILTAITAFADGDNKLKDSAWVKLYGETDVTASNEGGTKVYSFGGIEKAYITAGMDIMPALKAAMNGKSSVTVKFTVDLKATYKDGYDADDEYVIAMLVRAVGDISDDVKEQADFASNYEGSFFHHSNGNIMGRITPEENITINAKEWTTVEEEVVFEACDVNNGFWTKLMLCFDRMENFEMIDKLNIKNTGMYVVDSTEGGTGATKTPKPTQKPDGSSVTPNTSGDADTPALPKGNLLENNAWGKGVGNVNITTSEFKGNTVYSFSGITQEYYSAGIDIFKAMKKQKTDDDGDEISFWIVFDARARFNNNSTKEFPFGVKIRAYGLTENTNTSEAFSQNYTETGTFSFSDGNVANTLTGNAVMTGEWQRFEFYFCAYSYDINEEFWNQWILCFDRMKEFSKVSAIEVKNAGVYLEDDYEPINTEVDKDDDNESSSGISGSVTPTPVTIYKPYGFNKYPITFTDALAPDATATPAPTSSANTTAGATATEKIKVTEGATATEKINVTEGAEATEIAVNNEEGGINVGVIIAIIVAIAIIGGGVALALIIVKKQNKNDSEVNE